ncbi:MAG: hypothetical protein ACYTA5_23430 [Planctomycetota bacterium]
MNLHARSCRILAGLLGLCMAGPLLVGQGCPTGSDIPSTLQVVVKSPSFAQTVSAGQLVTVVYDAFGPAGTEVRAFYDFDGVVNTNDEVEFGSGLALGADRFTQLATTGLPAGALRIGITVDSGSNSITVYAGGVLTIVAGPSVSIVSPASSISVGPGVMVPLVFSTNQSSFDYRTFYDLDGVFNDDEITILEGRSTGSDVSSVFDTSGLSPKTYYVGVTITAASGSTDTTYAAGTVSVVTGAFVQVLAPTFGLVAEPGTPVQIIVAANDPSNSNATVRIFYDPDNSFANGNETNITTLSVVSSGASWDTTNQLPGMYYIGAELQNGMTPPLVSYSAGPVQIGTGGGGGTGVGRLMLTTPRVPTSLLQGKVYRVNWVTSLKPGEGTVTIFREPDHDDDGEPDGEDTREAIGNMGMDVGLQFVDFDTTGVLGKFFIGAILTPNPDLGDPETVYATGIIIIRLPLVWVGELDTEFNEAGLVVPQTGKFQGGVFRGHNFQDNLGSALLEADDYDGDGINEIVLAAQFGKPFIMAQQGRGAGEAYLLYGARTRFSGTYEVNTIGTSQLPGVVFPGIFPNPNPVNTTKGQAGNSIPYTVDGNPAPPYASEGLQSLALIPDQDGDGIGELVFSFPWCNSYSLLYQSADGFHPAPLGAQGWLENNGHFLRGGVVVVSSMNPILQNRTATSRNFDRVIQLHEVGQMFGGDMNDWEIPLPTTQDNCPKDNTDGKPDTVIFPCDGFWQNTTSFGFTGGGVSGYTFHIDPPRLADTMLAIKGGSPQDRLIISMNGGEWCSNPWNTVLLSQIDPPPGPADIDFKGTRWATEDEPCTVETGVSTPPHGQWPPGGLMYTLGTGFYATGTTCESRTYLPPSGPIGARILGQTTTQLFSTPLPTTANRFGQSMAVSGNFLLIGAPRRTVMDEDVPILPSNSRSDCGEIYMLNMTQFWRVRISTPAPDPNDPPVVTTTGDKYIPAPHNYIIEDVGYVHLEGAATDCLTTHTAPESGVSRFEMGHPLHVVGAAPGDRVGEVTSLYDINNDGIDDFAIGGAGTNGTRGAVYIIYRRQPEVEGDYLLERLQLDPNDLNRLNGLMILGQPNEVLGTAIGGGGAVNDDYNDDGYADLLIGSPNSSPASRFGAGRVFVLFGGRNLINGSGGVTIDELYATGEGMLLLGANPGEAAGTRITNAGDVNGDGVADILIAAPEGSPHYDSDGDGIADTIGLDLDGNNLADDLDNDGVADDLTHAGLVYVVFGGSHLTGTIGLELIGTKHLPGFIIVGRNGGDRLGGGTTQNDRLSRGVSSAGDLDGDGRDDLLISSILADPEDRHTFGGGVFSKTNAGEVYLIYGVTP